MQETHESGASSTDKCNDTTNVSTLNTSDEQVKQNSKKGKRTSKKRAGSGTNASSAKQEAEPLPMFLVNELSQLTFRIGEQIFQADTNDAAAWQAFVKERADIEGEIDWGDLEERAHFLNALYAFCQGQGRSFPLTLENLNENVIER